MNFPTDIKTILEKANSVDPVKYSRNRNYLDGDVTYLSPYITHGFLNIVNLKNKSIEKYGLEPSKNFVFELAWREYFQRYAYKRNGDIFNPIKEISSYDPALNFDLPKEIVEANTGIKVIDQAIKNLYEYGYVHNHARMWIAMYACNILGCDFYNLSKWMYYYLLDGDLASNTLSWQWVAGTLTGKKYFANQENLNKYDNKNKQYKTVLDISYGDLQNKIINCDFEKSESVTMEEAGIISNDWKHESLSKIELDGYLNQDKNKSEKIYLHNIFTLDPEWKKGLGIHLIFIEKDLLVSSPMSDRRLDFIYNLSKNIATESKTVYYYGDVEDLEIYRSRIHYKWHAFSNHIPGTMENSSHIFQEVADPTGSMMGWWKKCEDML